MNVIELLRKKSVEKLFETQTFQSSFPLWKNKIQNLTLNKTPRQIIDLGDNLSDIFRTSSGGGRTQSEVSSGGNVWESLVCWYLNLCSIGRHTAIIKHNRNLIPDPISDAITVNYNNFVSNTESDIIAITFPLKYEYKCKIEEIAVRDENGEPVQIQNKNGTYNIKEILNALCSRDFNEIGIHIIQCKTNWNDNAQIPMLWNMIYSAERFKGNITVGRNGYSIHNCANFTYSFVTVPTSRVENINSDSTCVKRVNNLSRGNYWGIRSRSNIASSIKEMLSRNFLNNEGAHLETLRLELANLDSKYNYFKL